MIASLGAKADVHATETRLVNAIEKALENWAVQEAEKLR